MERDRVVDPVAEEGDIVAVTLCGGDERRLLFRPGACEDRRPLHQLGQLGVGKTCQVFATGDARNLEPDLAADVRRRALIVAGQHLDLDAEALETRDRLAGIRFRGIGEDEEAQELEAGLIGIAVAVAGIDRPLGEREQAMAGVEQLSELRLDLVLDGSQRL